uniref:G-protein coupled receptors family 1 profile domain-containing protein n=1 Tax=Setaria digitata TaxID=48799 RepID=A0A915PJG6_9BILA
MDVVTDMTHINGTTNTSTDAAELSPLQCLPQMVIPQHQLNISGLFFLIIPAITVLGNSMVIIAVLRFKTLHSAINFLIFGLAVADLLVGLFVMPYAVYVHVQGGYWFLGSMMCDIYSASDVACSTASILILTVISFDRYRAVTHPISYSHKSHDTRRVIFIMIAIWVISLALASPIVLGVNIRPSDADPYECRFYNPIFSISSSMISFVIPCFIVLFVYIRIMIALRQRQKLSKAQHCSYSRPPKRLTKEAMTAVSSFDYSGQKAVTEIVETTEMARRQSAIDCDTNGLNFGKEKKKKLTGDTLATISKVNIFFSRKTERGNSKNGVRKLSKELDSCGICLNKNMNYDAEMIKISDANILNTEQINSKAKKSFSEELVAQMLQGLHYNSLPCPCRQATLNRLLKNDSKSKDSSAIFVPQPEIYKFCELQSESISANRQNENAYNVSKDTAFPEGFSLEAQPELSAEFVAQELSDNKPVEEKGSEKKKYDDRKRTESKIESLTVICWTPRIDYFQKQFHGGTEGVNVKKAVKS